MELTQVNTRNDTIIPEQDIIQPKQSNFIEANTQEVTLGHLKNDCIIPVFAKDNETTISHHEFINATNLAVMEHFQTEMLFPDIRVSHPIKGRIPSAIGKPAKELLAHEKTRYYERMAFSLELPHFTHYINDNEVNLSVIGVRAYNHENLHTKKSMEKFKVAIGYQVKVCLNLCLWTDGGISQIRVSSIEELQQKVLELISNYSAEQHFEQLQEFTQYSLTEKQFAQFLGKLRMYNFICQREQKEIQEILLNDSQVNSIAKGYYRDDNFKGLNGEISLWNLYNLMTAAVKSSYIDSFMDRNTNAFEICKTLKKVLSNSENHWLLN